MGIKFYSLMGITKKLKINETFFVFKDCDGWTNGFIADLQGLNTKQMWARAILRGKKCYRFNDKKEEGIDSSKMLGNIKENQEEVIDIEMKLHPLSVVLISATHRVAVNPIFLKYFQDTYKRMGGIKKLMINDFASPVQVFVGDERFGVVMAMRTEEDNK